VDVVDDAFEAVPRADFLPRGTRRRAGFDGPLPIGHGGTCSQPRTVADMLRLLDVRPGQRVLDVGSGSGWTTALLGHLVGPAGHVVGVEIEPHLARWGAENVARAGMPWAQARAADPAVLGLPVEGPWDRILVSAQAARLPQALVDQLADPGRLVVPVAGRMALVVLEGGVTRLSEHGYYRFVPLQPPSPPTGEPRAT
jgi:protein-L-isoaspartate(D-aspartate) O-methyltransferase